MLLVQVDNLIIPPPMSAQDYLRQLETEGLSAEDRAELEKLRTEGQAPPERNTESAEEEEEQEKAGFEEWGGVPPQLQHIFKKHFRQGRFLMATESEAAAARVVRDLGFAAFLNYPAAFVSVIAVREVDQTVVMQVSALTEWFAEVDTPVGKVFGLHYPSSWVNLPAPIEDPD